MRVTALTDSISTPAFPEGSTVRDTVTGQTYTVGQPSTRGNRENYWTCVVFPEPDADGCRVGLLPTDELEVVEVARISGPTNEQPALETRSGAGQEFAEYVDMLDSTGEIRATISDDGLDVTIGYERDFTIGGENGPTTFPLDAAHVSEFIRLLQRVEAAL